MDENPSPDLFLASQQYDRPTEYLVALNERISIPGDANLDGVFDSADLVHVLQAGKYRQGIPGNATLAEGDWNQDGVFNSSDLIFAMAAGHYRA